MKRIPLAAKIAIMIAVQIALYFLFGTLGFVLGHTEFAQSQGGNPGPVLTQWGFLSPVFLILISVAAALVWHYGNPEKWVKQSLILFFLQCFFYYLRIILIFVFGDIWLVMIAAILAALTTILCIGSFYRTFKWAGFLMIPYLFWLGYLIFLYADYELNDKGKLEETVFGPRGPVKELYIEKLPPVDLKGQIYQVISIDSLTWLAENLNYDIGEGSWCLDNDTLNCETYGRLYSLEGAEKACRELGWRLPTKKEWDNLRESHGNDSQAYEALIKGGESGFDGLLGGGYNSIDEKFEYEAEEMGNYWSGTPYKQGDEYFWKYAFRENRRFVSRDLCHKAMALSCRCVQD